jgi:hypothetical protein
LAARGERQDMGRRFHLIEVNKFIRVQEHVAEVNQRGGV